MHNKKFLLLSSFLCALLLWGCSGDAEPIAQPRVEQTEVPTVAASTKEMAQRLAAIQAQLKPQENAYMNSGRAELYGQQAAQTADLARKSQLMFNQSLNLLQAGKTREAIAVAEELNGYIDNKLINIPRPEQRVVFRQLLGICYMRLGEVENCIANHNSESCILPFAEQAQHELEEGSRKAIETYTKLLEEFPDHLSSVYLLNVAYMTLGEYPDKVPPQYLIPPSAFESQAEIPKFNNIAIGLGLNANGLSGGIVLDDFDGDHLLDVMASSWSLNDQVRYFHNNGDGTFEEQTNRATIDGITGGLNMNQADYDNDGDIDVLVLRGAWLGNGDHPNSLLRNNGNGTFDDVTVAAGLLSLHPTQAAAWGDYDNDGWLDLFIGNESSKRKAHPCELYHNNGDGTFTNVALELGVAFEGMIKGAAWGDVNNDGLIDLYVSNLTGSNKLFLNTCTEKGWRFEDATATAGVESPNFSFPTWMWDYNNDGYLDIFACAFPMDRYNFFAEEMAASYLGQSRPIDKPRLYRNKGDGTFENVSAQAGLNMPLFAMGSNYGDLDNDGFPDFYLGTGEPDFQAIIPNRMLKNDGKGGFADVTSGGGFGHLQKGHGIAFGDIDNDGDQDVYAVMGGAYEGDVFQNVLFENPGSDNAWISLKLVGEMSNKSAIGARIAVSVQTPEGERTIHTLVGSGGSFGASPLRAEIGLGSATSINRIEILWPGSNAPQVVSGIEPNRHYQVVEGHAPEQLALQAITFKNNESEHMHHHH